MSDVNEKLAVVQTKQDDMQKRFAELQAIVNQFDKKIGDNNTEQHKIKHDIANINAKFEAFTNIFAENQKTLREIHDLLLKSNYGEKIGELKGFVNELEKVTTISGFAQLFVRMDTQEKWRLRMEQNIWWLATLSSAAGAAVSFIVSRLWK